MKQKISKHFNLILMLVLISAIIGIMAFTVTSCSMQSPELSTNEVEMEPESYGFTGTSRSGGAPDKTTIIVFIGDAKQNGIQQAILNLIPNYIKDIVNNAIEAGLKAAGMPAVPIEILWGETPILVEMIIMDYEFIYGKDAWKFQYNYGYYPESM